MGQLFEVFPMLESDMLVIRKMVADDADALNEITSNDHVYRYIPPFLYKKSRGNLLAAIRNLGGRDFEKKRLLVAGIYRKEESDYLIGLAEIFDYKKRISQVTIGYRINENYWHMGIATETVRLLVKHLCGDMGIQTLKAFVMPENIYSEKVILKNGFAKEAETMQGQNWGGKEKVFLHEWTYHSA